MKLKYLVFALNSLVKSEFFLSHNEKLGTFEKGITSKKKLILCFEAARKQVVENWIFVNVLTSRMKEKYSNLIKTPFGYATVQRKRSVSFFFHQIGFK